MAAVIPLRSLIGDLDPTVCKLHCAVWNGEEHPIDHEGREYARMNLRFALLEFWSMRTSDEHVLAREAYWKDVLLSRKFGYNKN
jgi:hypothetical protein